MNEKLDRLLYLTVMDFGNREDERGTLLNEINRAVNAYEAAEELAKAAQGVEQTIVTYAMTHPVEFTLKDKAALDRLLTALARFQEVTK